MLKKTSFVFLCAISVLGYGWEFEEKICIEGILKRWERTRTTRFPNGEQKAYVERGFALVTNEPIAFSQTISIGMQQLGCRKTNHPHIEVYLPEEFEGLVGKRVKCFGTIENTTDVSKNEILFNLDTVLDCSLPVTQLRTLLYEPEEVEVIGMLYEKVYPGPPEYTNIDDGDIPEKNIILVLKEPINVNVKENDDFNESEKGVREIQIVFSNINPTSEQMKKEITLKGTLYHSHTAHHHRRVLMMVNRWSVAS